MSRAAVAAATGATGGPRAALAVALATCATRANEKSPRRMPEGSERTVAGQAPGAGSTAGIEPPAARILARSER